MVERTPIPQRPQPRLNSAQRLWLLELGLDRPMLARLMRDDVPPPARQVHAAMAPAPAETGSSDDRAPAAAALAALRQRGSQHGPAHIRRDPARSPSSTSAPGSAAAPPQGKAAEAEAGKAMATPAIAPEAGMPADWAALEARIQACQVCELHTGRQRAVAGSGAIEAVDWLVVGEAPGERDDRFGQPFQGKAGELLHAMLHAAGIDPAQAVFYTNLVKCRPRSNRLPTPDEIAACLPHLHSQIALLRPRGILALGRLAAHALLQDGQSDSKSFEALRGQVHHLSVPGCEAIPLVVTYHPASLLSRPRHKAASWRDLNLARTLR